MIQMYSKGMHELYDTKLCQRKTRKNSRFIRLYVQQANIEIAAKLVVCPGYDSVIRTRVWPIWCLFLRRKDRVDAGCGTYCGAMPNPVAYRGGGREGNKKGKKEKRKKGKREKKETWEASSGIRHRNKVNSIA